MKFKNFISRRRIAISLIISAVFVFVSMNFNPRNVNILASRSLSVVILDYVLNILLFFVVIYLVLSAVMFLYHKVFKHSHNN